MFAAGLKLIIPFIVVFPGIIAFNLYRDDMRADADAKDNAATLRALRAAPGPPGRLGHRLRVQRRFRRAIHPELARRDRSGSTPRSAGVGHVASEGPRRWPSRRRRRSRRFAQESRTAAGPTIVVQKELIGYKYDSAFGLLIKKLIPPGLRGFMLAAILGAVISSLASMLNAASTIFTMDIYRQYLNRLASQTNLVLVGRMCVLVFVAIGCFISPLLDNPTIRRHLHLHPGVPGLHLAGHPGRVHLRPVRQAGPAGLRHRRPGARAPWSTAS